MFQLPACAAALAILCGCAYGQKVNVSGITRDVKSVSFVQRRASGSPRWRCWAGADREAHRGRAADGDDDPRSERQGGLADVFRGRLAAYRRSPAGELKRVLTTDCFNGFVDAPSESWSALAADPARGGVMLDRNLSRFVGACTEAARKRLVAAA